MLVSTSIRQEVLSRPRITPRKVLLWAVCLLATVQFCGAYYFLEFDYLDYQRFEYGYERLPFQTRLLLAPLMRWADNNDRMVALASRLSENSYFFPNGISPQDVILFFLNIGCVLVAGYVAVRLYEAGTRQRILGWLVYPLFLGLCAMAYILHTVQNFRFVYDLPSMAFFSMGLFLIYFRKPVQWLVALFAVATLNRETTLLLLPFYLLSSAVDERGGFQWRRLWSFQVFSVVLVLAAYWAAWHELVFHIFRENASEYYPRVMFNLSTLAQPRYYPQIFSALGYLPVFLLLERRRVRDPQLKAWLWVLPVWLGFMFFWGILVETRIFGELIPYVACVSVIVLEEVLAARMARARLETMDSASEAERLKAA